MNRAMTRAALAAAALTLAACGDSNDAEFDFGGEDIGPDRFTVLTDDGNAKMALTDEWVYFGLSDEALARAQAEMDDDSAGEGLGGAIRGAVKGAVSKAIGFRAKYAVRDIRDIRWEDGEMVFLFEDPDRRLGDDFRLDDQPVSEAFTQEDVEAFAEAFRRVKGRQGSGG